MKGWLWLRGMGGGLKLRFFDEIVIKTYKEVPSVKFFSLRKISKNFVPFSFFFLCSKICLLVQILTFFMLEVSNKKFRRFRIFYVY